MRQTKKIQQNITDQIHFVVDQNDVISC